MWESCQGIVAMFRLFRPPHLCEYQRHAGLKLQNFWRYGGKFRMIDAIDRKIPASRAADNCLTTHVFPNWWLSQTFDSSGGWRGAGHQRQSRRYFPSYRPKRWRAPADHAHRVGGWRGKRLISLTGSTFCGAGERAEVMSAYYVTGGDRLYVGSSAPRTMQGLEACYPRFFL